jgi:hypothetical protein
VRAAELAGFGWMRRDAAAASPGVLGFVAWFNQASFWAASCVLAQPTAARRAHAQRKLVKVAFECWTLGNFHAVFEIVAGLQMHAVARLRELRPAAALPPRERAKLEALLAFFSPQDNFARYRQELARALSLGAAGESYGASPLRSLSAGAEPTFNPHPLVLPHLGIALKDLAVQRERPALLPDGAVDFARCRRIAQCVLQFTACQEQPCRLRAAPRLQAALSAEIAGAFDEVALSALSYAIEPRLSQLPA